MFYFGMYDYNRWGLFLYLSSPEITVFIFLADIPFKLLKISWLLFNWVHQKLMSWSNYRFVLLSFVVPHLLRCNITITSAKQQNPNNLMITPRSLHDKNHDEFIMRSWLLQHSFMVTLSKLHDIFVISRYFMISSWYLHDIFMMTSMISSWYLSGIFMNTQWYLYDDLVIFSRYIVFMHDKLVTSSW